MARIFLVTLAGLCAIAGSPPEQSVSVSRQFITYGSDSALRGAVCDLAEGTKRQFLKLTDQRDDWASPIVINLQHPKANLPELARTNLTLAQTGFGLKVQLNLKITPDLTQTEIRRELLRSILLEAMYRHAPSLAAETPYLPPPEWLVIGIYETISGSPGPFLQSRPDFYSIDDFLRERACPIDLPGRAFYRTGSIALIESLVHQDNGRNRLGRLISDLPRHDLEGPTNALRTHFPELFDHEGQLQRVWLAWIEQLARTQSSLLLSGEQTERILNEMLDFEISKDRRLRETYRMVLTKLDALAVSANPLYRPVIAQYQVLIRQLARGKTTGVSGGMARLRASRRDLNDRLERIADYLNWFEATNARQPSGLFSGYLEAAKEADGCTRKRRHDPISVYLDAFETEFENTPPSPGTVSRWR